MDSDNRPPTVRPVLALSLVSLLFIASGATGLAYEVLWFRQFSDFWGGSSAAMAAVVASFLFGLGLGARLIGALADRSQSPLFAYAICELCIGVLALALPYEIDLIRPFTSSIYPSLASEPFLFSVVRFLITFAILGPPTILMGATLPLLVRQFSLAGSSLASSAAWLYFLNSFGAAAGAWVTGFFLLPTFGLRVTNWMTVSVNFLIALTAWALVREVQSLVAEQRPEPEAEPAGEKRKLLPFGLAIAAFITGVSGVSLQMVWARQMSLAVGGTTYAFTSVLSVFILGLALGSLAFRLFVRSSTSLHRVLSVSVIGLVVTTIFGWVILPELGEVIGSLSHLRAEQSFNAQLCFLVSLAMEGLPTFFMGVLFPTLVALSGGSERTAGRVVGQLYAWNAGGSIVAATTTSALLFPSLGGFLTILLMLFLYGLILLWFYLPRLRTSEPAAFGVVGLTFATLGIGGFLGWPDIEDTVRRNIGYYLYSDLVYDTHGKHSELLFYKEAPVCNVMVLSVKTDNPTVLSGRSVNIRVNGKVDGGNYSDVNTQIGSAYFPRMLRPRASSVLVIGFGTGSTAGASSLFANTKVECCEIEQAVVDASKFFHDVNHKPEFQPNYTTIITDGRNHVQSTDRVYDLIISEPSNPWIAGISKLYTTEFYESVRERLASGGMLAQWLQTYSIGRAEFSLIINTIQSVFPHSALIRLAPGDTMLLASMEPIVPDRATIDYAQELIDSTPVARDELAKRFHSSDVRTLLLEQVLLDRLGLERIVLEAGQSEVNTDQNLRLEFDAPRRLFGIPPDDEIGAAESILHALDVRLINDLIASWGWSEEQLGALLRLRTEYLDAGHSAMAIDLSSIGMAYTDEVMFLADQLIFSPPADLEELRLGVNRVLEKSRLEAKRVALQLGQRSEFQRSAAAYEELLRRFPDSASLHASLSIVYRELGFSEAAELELARALELDPLAQETIFVERAAKDALRPRGELGAGENN